MKYNRKFIIVAVALSIGLEATAFAEKLKPLSVSQKIENFYKKGKISEAEYAIETLRAYFKPKSIKDKFKQKVAVPNRPTRAITLLLAKAKKHIEEYNQKDAEFLKALLKRPIDSDYEDEVGIPYYLPSPVKSFVPNKATYPNIGGKYKFWYVEHNKKDKSGTTHTTTLAKVKEMARTFEYVFKREINEMKYKKPLSDTGSSEEGGDSKFDIYLMNIGSNGIYGFVASEYSLDGGNGVYTYMVLDNDFSREEFNANPTDSMHVTVAHEHHHAIQMAYNVNTTPWFMEATSTWIEEHIYDDINDNRQFLQLILNYPELPLDTFNENGHQYAAWIFNEYLSLKWGEDTIRKIWNKLDPNDSDNSAINAIESIANEKGKTLKTVLTEFWAKNYQKDSFYEEGREWGKNSYEDAVYIENIETPHKMKVGDIATESVSLDHLSAKLYRFLPDDTITTEHTLKIELTRTENIGAIAIAKMSDGTYKEYPIGNSNSVAIPKFAKNSTTEVVLVMVNSGKTTEDDKTISTYKGTLSKGNNSNVNEDKSIDEVVKKWSSQKGDIAYDSSYDFDDNGEINVIDIMTVVNSLI